MMDIDANNDSEEQIRISLVLSKTCTDTSLIVPSDPIAIPSTTRKKGLSAIVNHLLDRKVVKEENSDSEEESDNDDSDDDEDKLPSIPFDFLVNNKLLRLTVEGVARREGLSFEKAVEIQYFPARLAPQNDGETEALPDWISAMSNSNNTLCTGSCDGSLRVFQHGEKVGLVQHDVIKAHSQAVKCISSSSGIDSSQFMIASGSMDHTLLTHSHQKGDIKSTLALHAVYSGGHASSINSVALSSVNGSLTMASGDWNGGLCIWKVPQVGSSQNSVEDNMEKHKRKKQKSSSSKTTTTTEPEVNEVSASANFKAHSNNVSGVTWGNDSTLFTSSWDHSIKSWDIESQNVILTLNGAKVVTCLGLSHNSSVVATGHPDCCVRLWDMRTSNTSSEGQIFDGTLRPSHKAWISAVQWSPDDPFVLASSSHDGSVKVWDIRSSLPLHTVRAHSKGEKALCLAFADKTIFSGGSDCIVKKFKL